MTTSAILGIPYIASQQSQPDVTHNEAVSLLQIILAGGAITIGDNTPPVSPVEGDTYVVGDTPTGDWAGRANAIAGFFLNQWLFVPGNDSNGTPIVMGPDQEGLSIWSKTDDGLFVWTDLGASPGVLSWRPEPSSITQLALLDDTSISAPQDCDLLMYIDGLWRNLFSNTVFYSEESQLPTPSAGVIQLLAEKRYYLTAAFAMSNRLQLAQGTTFVSNSLNSPLLTYTGTGTFITGVDVDCDINNIQMTAPSGTVFDISETVGGLKICLIHNVEVQSCAKYANFTNLLSIVLSNSNCLDADDGITLDGVDWTIQSFIKFALVSAETDFTGIDLGSSVSPTVEFDNLVLAAPASSPSTAVGIKGLADGGNLPAGSIGTITNSSFLGGITPLEGITSDDVRWSFGGNSANVDDTMPDALLSLSSNATPTTVSGGAATLITGTWTEERASHFTTDANGRITYIGERPLVVPINLIATVEPTTGVNKDVEIYIALNGTEIAKTKMVRRTDSGNPGVVSTMWQLRLEQNNFIEGFVANASDDVSVLVSDAILRLR